VVWTVRHVPVAIVTPRVKPIEVFRTR
jgi:hypothetical protein